MPLLLLLVLATVDIGLGFRTYMVLTNGARETVRWITTNPTDTAGATQRATVEARRIGLELGEDDIVISPSAPTYVAGERVTATIAHDYELMFGFFTAIPTLPIRARATMVVLYND